jgi:hypothetical protein
VDTRGWLKRVEDASWAFYMSTKSAFTHTAPMSRRNSVVLPFPVPAGVYLGGVYV